LWGPREYSDPLEVAKRADLLKIQQALNLAIAWILGRSSGGILKAAPKPVLNGCVLPEIAS
jgi:hypothetical protein